MVFAATKKVELPNFGEKLKGTRESLGLSREKVVQLLNIQLKYLERLEEGEWEKLPAQVYMNGLLRRYAKLLAVDEGGLLAEYVKELNIVRHLNRSLAPRPLPVLRWPRLVITPRTLAFVAGCLFSVLAVGYFFYQFSILISRPELLLEQPSGDLATGQAILEVSGRTDPAAQLTINNQPVYIDKEGKFKEILNLSPGLNTLKIVASNRFGKSRELVRQILVK